MTGSKLRSAGLSSWLANYNGEIAYKTDLGVSIVGKSEDVLTKQVRELLGQVQLIFTSPPFPLNRKKKYDNLTGDEFKKWLAGYASILTSLLKPDGSIVIEMGNAWEPGKPVMSTLAIESLLEFKKAAGLQLCQEFIWHNPAKLPTPAQWVTVDRIRVKDSFTRIWWLSPIAKPKADNRRVLVPYSPAMRSLLKKGSYNAGKRPSEHLIGQTSFLTDNGGAIPANVLTVDEPSIPSNVLVGSNTSNSDGYQRYCVDNNLEPHPARMPAQLAKFFIKLCTDPGDIVLDPFGGSNTTGGAAEELRRRWITVEANAGYAKSGRCRFSHFV